MNRAQRGQDLFIDKVDYQQFIGLLQESTDLEGALRTIFIDEKTVGADDGWWHHLRPQQIWAAYVDSQETYS